MRKYFKKLNFIYCLIILLTLLSNPAIAQETEVSEFETGKVYQFTSKGRAKSYGLGFSIKYPESYSMVESANAGILAEFTNTTNYSLTYNIEVIETPTIISKKSQKNILSRKNLETSTKSIVEGADVFGYQDRLKVDNMNAAYIDYIISPTLENIVFIRQYYIIRANYLISITFYLTAKPGESFSKYQNYSHLYKLVTRSLSFD